MVSRDSGNLLVGILSTLLLLAIGVGAFLKCTANWTGIHQSAAIESARGYARELGLEVDAISCVKQDSDGDGYVSCTLKFADGTRDQIECAGAMNLNEGCRDPKINVRDGGLR